MEKMALKDIGNGRTFKGVICVLKSFKRCGDEYLLTLTDKYTSCDFAFVKTNLFSYEQMKSFEGKPVEVTGLHEPGLTNVKKERIKVKNIVLCEDGKELLQELAEAIAEPLLLTYLERVELFKGYVGKEVPAYRKLLEAYFTPDNIRLMKSLPATHIRQGSPYGGMLHATLVVTEMAYYSAMRYLRFGNGLYSFSDIRSLNWDLLLTGGLMHLAGNFLYFSQDEDTKYRKNATGVEQGFSLCRQQYILQLIAKEGIDISQADLAALLGVMSRLNEQHDGIKKCRQEASFLYNAYNMFLEMDSFDMEVSHLLKSKQAEDVDYTFSEKLNCYISEKELTRKRVLLGLNNKEANEDAV